MQRIISELESDLVKCSKLLETPVSVKSVPELSRLKEQVVNHYHLFDDVFVPASVTEDEAATFVEKMKKIKVDLKTRETEIDELIQKINQWREDGRSLSLWMSEVKQFLKSEDVLESCEPESLEAQMREVEALQSDILTIQPNYEHVRDTGLLLISSCDDSDQDYVSELNTILSNIDTEWQEIQSDSAKHSERLREVLSKTQDTMKSIREINIVLDQIESDLASEPLLVTTPLELSQTTLKLLKMRERATNESGVLDQINGDDRFSSHLDSEISATQSRWRSVFAPLNKTYEKFKDASDFYGEFKTLIAHEKDWLDRLERKLQSTRGAADAEEISEELDDLENWLYNHSDERLEKLQDIAVILNNDEDFRLQAVVSEVRSLQEKWVSLEVKARKRISGLESCIAEAQEWECRVLGVQDWLVEKDLLLTSHLEHEMTLDDLFNEVQVCKSLFILKTFGSNIIL